MKKTARELLEESIPELQIKRAILDWLTAKRIPHSETDARRVYNESGQLIRVVRTKGWFDITAILPGGRFWGIEVKTKKKSSKLSADQEKVRDEIRAFGGVATEARSVDDVEVEYVIYANNRKY